MINYLINLDRSPDRLADAKKELDLIGLDYVRVPAIDGREFDDREFNKVEAESEHIFGKALNRGEIGCYQSHLKCLRLFLETDQSHCLVLEDDFSCSLYEPTFLLSVLEQICTQDFNVVNLSKVNKRFFTDLAEFENGKDRLKLRISHNFPYLTTALVWSRKGAERFLRDFGAIRRPVDVEIQCWVARVGGGLAFDNPPVASDKLESVIDEHTARDFEAKPMLAEIRRLQRQIKFYVFGYWNLIRQKSKNPSK